MASWSELGKAWCLDMQKIYPRGLGVSTVLLPLLGHSLTRHYLNFFRSPPMSADWWNNQVVCSWATGCISRPIRAFTRRLLSRMRVENQFWARFTHVESKERPTLPSSVARACSRSTVDVSCSGSARVRCRSRAIRSSFCRASRWALTSFSAALRTSPSAEARDRKSTRLNSSHGYISYAVFCLKKKKHRINRASNDIG